MHSKNIAGIQDRCAKVKSHHRVWPMQVWRIHKLQNMTIAQVNLIAIFDNLLLKRLIN